MISTRFYWSVDSDSWSPPGFTDQLIQIFLISTRFHWSVNSVFFTSARFHCSVNSVSWSPPPGLNDPLIHFRFRSRPGFYWSVDSVSWSLQGFTDQLIQMLDLHQVSLISWFRFLISTRFHWTVDLDLGVFKLMCDNVV